MRAKICDSGTDNLTAFGCDYSYEGGLSLQQNPDEFASLCLRLKEHAPYTNYLEIGSASGGACLFLWRELGFRSVLCIDDGQHPRAKEQDANLRLIPNSHRFVGDSHSLDAPRFVQDHLHGKVDLAFIDGDHSYSGVSQDIELVIRFSRRGTLIVLHDTIACDGVDQAWLECIEQKMIHPLAEYIGQERPLGIGIGEVI